MEKFVVITNIGETKLMTGAQVLEELAEDLRGYILGNHDLKSFWSIDNAVELLDTLREVMRYIKFCDSELDEVTLGILHHFGYKIYTRIDKGA